MIYNYRIAQLRNSELLQFLADVLTLCSQYSTEPMKLAVVILALSSSTTEFDKCFKIAPGSAFTDELIFLDGNRDKCIKGIRTVIVGYTNHYQPAIQKAAKDLLASIDKYGKKIYALNYESETNTITNLVADWKATVLAAALTLLNLLDWSTELDTSNKIFNTKYMSRLDEKTNLPQVKTFICRKQAIECFTELVNHIEARALLAEEPIYDPLINHLNTLVARYNQIADSHENTEVAS